MKRTLDEVRADQRMRCRLDFLITNHDRNFDFTTYQWRQYLSKDLLLQIDIGKNIAN